MAKDVEVAERGEYSAKDYHDPPPAPLIDPEELTQWSFYRALIAEFIATLLFLYITVLTVIGYKSQTDPLKNADQCGGVGILGIAWAFGGMIFVLVYCTAGISGGHINPAVTFGLFLARKVSLIRAVLYMVAQCLGAICGVGLVKAFQKSLYTRYGGGCAPISSRPRISCIGWDPEGILGPPQTGHIARREFKKRLEKDSEAREAFERQVREEKERRRAIRQSRVIPDTPDELVEYFLNTEAQEFEVEIARLRTRLNQEFFSHLQFELGQLRFAVSKTQDMEDRLVELEALQKALLEGTEAYDKMQADLIAAKENLTKILTSKDLKATLLEMVERNELNRSLLTLLDENIANAHEGNQKQAAEFMEKLRGAVLRYMTV